jgi:hypothetical protein
MLANSLAAAGAAAVSVALLSQQLQVQLKVIVCNALAALYERVGMALRLLISREACSFCAAVCHLSMTLTDTPSSSSLQTLMVWCHQSGCCAAAKSLGRTGMRAQAATRH